MLINEACDAVNQGVCTEEAVNQAMRLGVNYPQGPFDWLEQWSAADVAFLLDSMDDFYRGERYRVSPMLRRKSCEELLNE
jgi:3-hydroxybutyryl-CoA dehydrogenase